MITKYDKNERLFIGSIMDYNIFLSTLTNIQNFTLHSIQNTDISNF